MSDLERVWEECWARVVRGEATIEDCLRRYPEHADALGRLFKVVVRLNQGRLVHPNAEFKARARAAVLEQIKAHPRTRAQPSDVMPAPGRMIPFPLRASLALAVILFLLLVSGIVLAQAALPGDPLYGWKTGGEDVFRAVYPDPLTADLIVLNVRANELVRVAGTPAAEHVAAERYQQVLSDLSRHTGPSSESKIREQLTEQKTQLQKAGVTVPAIDRTLKTLNAAPPITPPPAGATSGGKTTPAAPAGPAATQTPNPVLTTKPTPTHTATSSPTRGSTLTPTPTRTPPATSALTGTPREATTPSRTPPTTSAASPTPNVQATEGSTTPASFPRAPSPISTNNQTQTRANIPTPTPCVTQTTLFSVSPADACATPMGDCGTVSAEESHCGTPTRTASPSLPESTTSFPSRSPKHTPTGSPESPNSSGPELP